MDKCTGAIFALKNMGWKDKVETEVSSDVSTQEAYINCLRSWTNQTGDIVGNTDD